MPAVYPISWGIRGRIVNLDSFALGVGSNPTRQFVHYFKNELAPEDYLN